MDDILNQQASLLRFGEDLLKESSRKLREAAGPDALRQAYNLWRGFVEAVDWSETWIRCLLGFHLTMLALALVTRTSESAQTIIFLVCACLVFAAEPLNTLARNNWRAFSGQDYFDERGLFATTVFSTPLLVILAVVLVNFLIITAAVMVKTKRAQLTRRQRRETADAERKNQ